MKRIKHFCIPLHIRSSSCPPKKPGTRTPANPVTTPKTGSPQKINGVSQGITQNPQKTSAKFRKLPSEKEHKTEVLQLAQTGKRAKKSERKPAERDKEEIGRKRRACKVKTRAARGRAKRTARRRAWSRALSRALSRVNLWMLKWLRRARRRTRVEMG